MEMFAYNYRLKIKSLLRKILHVKAQRKIDEDTEKIFATLCQLLQTDGEKTSYLPLFTKWIKEVVITWSASRVTPQTNVASFILNLASLLSQNEEIFCNLNINNFFIKLVNITKARQVETETVVKLAYVKLLSSFLEHTSGIELMMVCNFWEDVLQLSLSNQNDQIVTESTRFLSKMLEKTLHFDDSFCNTVVNRIMLPLGENIYKSIKASDDKTDVNDQVASKCLKPTLNLIGNLLESYLEGIYFGRNDFEIVLIFFKNFHLEERIADFMIMAQIKCVAFHVKKIMYMMEFLELYVKIATNSCSLIKISAAVRRMKTSFMQNLSKGTYEDVVEFCTFGQLLWGLMISKIPFGQVKDENQLTLFSNQLGLFLIFPHYCLFLKYCWGKRELEELLQDEIRDSYIHNIFQMLDHDAVRIAYGWREELTVCVDLFEITNLCSVRIKNSQKYFSEETAQIIAEMLIYNLKDIFVSVTKDMAKLKYFVNETEYFRRVLELITIFIGEFKITWKNTYEAINVLNIAFDFLMMYQWPSCIAVEVLKLINVATAKYMTPNLALLLDSTTDPTIALLGSVLYARVHGEDSVVRCAALEIVCTLASISGKKFPSLQKVLMDSELPTLVVKMSTCDGESFVRATAIKCLQEMIQVEEIWNNALRTEDLSQKMRDVLLNETEGIVRVEAATFMCVAYEHGQFPRDTIDSIYETMIYSSTTDLHWEVKVRALNFWDKVIKNHLQNQGMIDGSFPNVTFSKEHRKIVTLTDSEIRKRLLKVLSQLSSIGCLGVLTSAIKDDCDMEVSKTAVKITQKLIDLLKKYNVRSNCSAPTSPLPTENGMSATVSMSSGISVDESMDSPGSGHPDLNEEIIEQIVNSKDVNLLKNVYTPSDYGSVSNYDIQVRKIITPDEFLQFTQQDLNNIITEKKKWLNGIEDLGSLLDDMLKTYEDDVNNMDCY